MVPVPAGWEATEDGVAVQSAVLILHRPFFEPLPPPRPFAEATGAAFLG